MNRIKSDILNNLMKEPFINQRILAELSGYSLGGVNNAIKELIKEGYLNNQIMLTTKAIELFEDRKPQNAIILAAGFGMRMVPINTETPKGLLEVRGEPLIERIIYHLHEVGIKKIYIVVGFMKEHYEYLIDEYGVELIVNNDYAKKNNLYSLYLASEHLSDTYVIPCDIWCERNPFNQFELYSWYMVSDLVDNDSTVRVNRKMMLVKVPEASAGNAMIGISYLMRDQSLNIKERIRQLCKNMYYDGAFWEETLYENNRMLIEARMVSSSEVVEINTYEQLRELDCSSKQLETDAILAIANALNVKQNKIENITVLKKGMTNRSFLFECQEKKYIMRIPGEGTDNLINRKEEALVYETIKEKHICDDVIYINPQNGYKITRYLEDVRVCDADNLDDIAKCMKKLRMFHEMKLEVKHEFDIFSKISFYESLWKGIPSAYKDYKQTKENVLLLKSFIEAHIENKTLTHIDAVADNFLIVKDSDGDETIHLIDWEYAGMQDPHVDIAMFCIYSLYDRYQVDRLIDVYFPEGCSDVIRLKIYCYISACGLLWSNWCEYKRCLGVEFGEYSLRQYRYAKDYFKIAMSELEKKEEKKNGI